MLRDILERVVCLVAEVLVFRFNLLQSETLFDRREASLLSWYSQCVSCSAACLYRQSVFGMWVSSSGCQETLIYACCTLEVGAFVAVQDYQKFLLG